MGAVYRGVHVETGQEVALKTVLVAHANELAAIRTEIQALRQLDHPGIIRILDAGTEGGSPWYAMELLEGVSLSDFHRSFWSEWTVAAPQDTVPSHNAATLTQKTGASGPVFSGHRLVGGAPVAAGKLQQALTLAYRLCAPLAYLHRRGIVHRDLKPGNIFVRTDGRPVLVDFGLVSRFGAAGRDVLEIAGTLAGTAAYMAPEQILRQRVDARTDLYALGCILFDLLAGRPPFLGGSVAELLRKQLTEVPSRSSDVVTGVPAPLDALLERLLAKRARDRIGHAEDVSTWLADLGAEVDTPSTTSAEVPSAYLYQPEVAGRDDVLETLNRHSRRLLDGVGGCILIGGESGVGKTSVVAEVARAATLQQMTVIGGECQPLGGALHPLVPLLNRIVDKAVEGGPNVAKRMFGDRARVLAAVDPGVARIPGFADAQQPADLPADAARARLLADLRETIAAFTEEQPILLVLDDLQWADALTLQFLLATRVEFLERNALLIVGTFRSDEQPELLRDLLEAPGIVRLDLGRLDTPAIGAMVGDMLAVADPPLSFIEFVAGQSEGNPFFVAEYLRTAVAERLLQRTAGRWVFGDAAALDHAGYAHLALPASIRDLIARRLTGLPAHAHGLAEIASVIGREIDADLLLNASGIAEAEAMDAIRELATRQVIDRVEGGRYRFLHDKLREITYGSIEDRRRSALHRRAAESLQDVYRDTEEFPRLHGSLAFHYERAGDRPHAIEFLEKASEYALRAYADRDVANYLTTALRLDAEGGALVDPQRRASWRTSVGMALRGLGELEEGRWQLEQALEGRGYPVPTGAGLAGVGWLIGRELALRRSLKFPPVAPRESDVDAERALNAYNYVAMIAYHQSDVAGQLFCAFAALRLAPAVGPSPPAAQLYATAGNIFGFFGIRTLAWRYARLSHEIARATGQDLSLGVVHQYSGHLAALLGEMTTFDTDIHRALDLYTRVGHGRFREEALTNCAHLYNLRGELVRSLDTFREIERSGAARDDVQTATWGQIGQARMMALMGQMDEALRRLDEAVPRSRDDLAEMDGLGARALTLAQIGDAARARGDIVAVLKLMEQSSKTSYTSISAYSNALEALFHLQPLHSTINREDLALARRLIAAFRRFTRVIRLARPRLQLWVGVLEWHLGHHSGAMRAWKRALDGAQRVGLPFDAALAHFWIGRCGSGAERKKHLTEAMQSFENMQATWHAGYARGLT